MLKGFLALFSGNLISKALGLVREILLAWAFGLTATAAAIRIAMAALFIPINLLTQDLLAAGFLPIYNEYAKQDKKLANAYFGYFFICIIALSVFIVITLLPFAAPWVNLLATGFSDEAKTLTTHLFQIFLLSTPFILGVSALSYRALAANYYFIQAMRPSFQNIGLIIAILLANHFSNVMLIAFGFLATQILFFSVSLIWFLHQPWGKLQFNFSKQTSTFNKELWLVMKPIIALPLIMQGYFVLERNIASRISEGTVASLEITKFVTETSMALIAIPLGLILLTRYSERDRAIAKVLIDKIAVTLLILISPIATCLVFAPELVVRILFERGAFDAEATITTADIMRLFGFGLFLHAFNYQLLKLCNAFKLSSLFTKATIAGLFVGGVTLLFYKHLGLQTFGLAYVLNGLTITVYLSMKLYNPMRLLQLSIGLITALAGAFFASTILIQTSIELQFITAAFIVVVGVAITTLVLQANLKRFDLIHWLKNS